VRVLATGISGFAGHHLVADLIGAGHEVHGVFWNEREPVPTGVVGVHYGDITDEAAMSAAVAAVAPELVFHLAGVASVGESIARPIATWHVNLDGTLVLLEALREHAPTARCVAITSGEVYGKVAIEDLPVGLETPMRPYSPYGASKAAADLAALQYHLGYGMPVLRVRAFNHIGPGQDPRFLVPTVARQIAVGERDGASRIDIHVGNVDTRRDFTDVRDIVRAYRLIAERGSPEIPYLACTGRSVAVRDLIDGLASLATVETTITSDATLRREGEQPDLYGSPDRLTADTGWVPQIPLDVSLKDTLDWWRRRVAEED
jgi:GDP-4-dehydro-6-deoxy-D-mannose reductase